MQCEMLHPWQRHEVHDPTKFLSPPIKHLVNTQMCCEELNNTPTESKQWIRRITLTNGFSLLGAVSRGSLLASCLIQAWSRILSTVIRTAGSTTNMRTIKSLHADVMYSKFSSSKSNSPVDILRSNSSSVASPMGSNGWNPDYTPPDYTVHNRHCWWTVINFVTTYH